MLGLLNGLEVILVQNNRNLIFLLIRPFFE